MSSVRRRIPSLLLAIVCLFFLAAQAQEPRKTAFRAVNYEVSVSIVPAEQRLVGRARVTFEAKTTSRLVEVELHPNLRVRGITGADGRALEFEQDENTPMLLRVNLPQSVETGQTATVNFEYEGRLSGDENSPVKGVQLANISSDTSYLFQAARWFPLTDYGSNRYTATFRIDVPEELSVTGTGRALPTEPYTPPAPAPPPSAQQPGKGGRPGKTPATPPPAPAAAAPPVIPAGPRTVFIFRSEAPEAGGSFVIGALRVVPTRTEGLDVPVDVPASAAASAPAYGESLARAVAYFTSEFGPPARRRFGIVQIPDGTVQAYSAPGMLFVSQRQWDPKVNYRVLARLAALQWWGNDVMPAGPADAWLSDGLARYCEALYVESLAGTEGFNRALQDFAVGALMFEDVAPVGQAQRLTPYSSEYRSVVMNKGALVFHMLRAYLGDAAFKALLRDFHTKYTGKTATLADFQKLAQDKANEAATGGKTPINLSTFFAQWLNSTGVPEFKIEYVVFRTQKGFRIDGKVKQDFDTFRLPVELKVDTEGNPEFKTIDVVGAESTFSIETFGRPKANGLTLDPHNNMLKSSMRLRIRAAIARGEELAELGRFYDAIQQYQRALDVQSTNSLAHFRTGEAMFFQKNLQASANAFREAQVGDADPSDKWVVVWSHLYLGKIFDLTGQRERAVNEYQKAIETSDDTGGAQAEAQKYLQTPYTEDARKTAP